MSRSFSVRGYRRVLAEVLQEVRWDVYADSHEDAERMVRNGDYDDYEVLDDRYETLDDCYDVLESVYDVEDVECDDCGCSEGCGCDEDEDRPGLGAIDLVEGRWYKALADEYSRDQFPEDQPVLIRYVSDRDNDGEFKVEFMRPDGTKDYWYVRSSCRFEVAEGPSDEEFAEAVAEREREKEEFERRVREQRGVNLLLNV
ncbi:hypothetical protein MINTM005_12990 [Mycobacterium intracellulare]|uniref:hypothetical protein n=1 Tax=Mycobacterium intracellulare TaxID=1767 RepID=UPI0019287B4C|nr:hypothetical protein [Mycobacterium intracellulare]BCO56055.1 hypothetical protein MINTM005_12990 [Mycobacterium intracellulare]